MNPLIAVDLDGTIDADPAFWQWQMKAWQAAGATVVVLTGCASNPVTTADQVQKTLTLGSLGVTAYNHVVVVPNPAAKPKAAWLKANGATLLVDNDVPNAKAAKDLCLVLVPWATKKKGGGGK